MSPLLLALDTSTRSAGVALFDGEHVLAETTWLAGREHSTRLLVEVEAALARVDRTVEEITGVVVARGPGSFTGVRVALSVAKGIAAARRLPAWGVSSLDVLAFAMGPTEWRVCAALEAGRGRYAVGFYASGSSVEAPRLMDLDALLHALDVPTLVVGELTEEARLRIGADPHARLTPRAASARRAGYLAELGWRAAASGDPGDPRGLDALYVT